MDCLTGKTISSGGKISVLEAGEAFPVMARIQDNAKGGAIGRGALLNVMP